MKQKEVIAESTLKKDCWKLGLQKHCVGKILIKYSNRQPINASLFQGPDTRGSLEQLGLNGGWETPSYVITLH